VVVVPYW